MGLLLCACSDSLSEPDVGVDPTVDGANATNPGTAKTALAIATELEKPLHRYTIDLGEGHAVSYRVYADGAMIVGEQGRLNVDEVVTKSANYHPIGPVDLFQKVHPGSVVPDELLKIQAFMEHAGPADAPDDESLSVGSGSASFVGSVPQGSIPKDTTSDPASFLNNFGCFFGSGDVFDVCVPNWAGPAFAQANSRWAIYKIAPFKEGLRFNTTIAGTPRVSLSIFQGGFWVQTQAGPTRTYKNNNSYPDVVTHRLDIFSTGEHHFSARFHNYETLNPNCAELWSIDNSWRYVPTPTSTIAVHCTSHFGLML